MNVNLARSVNYDSGLVAKSVLNQNKTDNTVPTNTKQIAEKPTSNKTYFEAQIAKSNVEQNKAGASEMKQLSGERGTDVENPTAKQAPSSTNAFSSTGSVNQKFMVGSNTGSREGQSETSQRSDNVKANSQKTSDGESSHSDANPMSIRHDNNMPRGNSSTISSRYARRSNEDEYEDEDDNNQRRRRKKAQFIAPKKPLTVLEGARVAESNTQDMFVSSSVTAERVSGVKRKTTIEQLKEYSMNDLSVAFFNIVRANINTQEKNGIGAGMQREVFSEIVQNIQDIDDVLDNNYRLFVRDIVQGSMKAAHQGDVALKDVAKIIITGLMAMSPHDDNPNLMADTLKIIVSEIMYGKVNIGYNMKDAAFAIGASSFTLGIYYKEYQNDIKFDQNLENKLNSAFSEAVWTSTGEISNYSQAYAKANIEKFIAGRTEEEKLHQKVMVKEMLLSPFKKVLNK